MSYDCADHIERQYQQEASKMQDKITRLQAERDEERKIADGHAYYIATLLNEISGLQAERERTRRALSLARPHVALSRQQDVLAVVDAALDSPPAQPPASEAATSFEWAPVDQVAQILWDESAQFEVAFKTREARIAVAQKIVDALVPVPSRDAVLEALEALVAQILEYERINNLSPNPGRKYCWDATERAVNTIAEARGWAPLKQKRQA